MKESLDFKSNSIVSSTTTISNNISSTNGNVGVVIFRQDDSKLNLLKQIKITLESLMFGSNGSSMGFANTLHKFNPINFLFCKHIMAILEDGFNSNINSAIIFKNPSFISSSSSLDSSSPPTEQFNLPNSSSSTSTSASSSMSNSRKTTQTSLSNKNPNETVNLPPLWLFILNILSDNNNLITSSSPSTANIEYSAKKDFKNICNQIQQQQQQHQQQDNTNPINQQTNIVLDWISFSLRQHCLLTQLTFLLNDDFVLRKFYNLNSFLLDRTLVDDFLIFIQAYEQNNVKLINKVKRNFFANLQNSPIENNMKINSNVNNRHKKQNSADLTSIMKLQQNQPQLISSQSIDLFNPNNLKVVSAYSSINDLNADGISSSVAQSVNSLTDSLIELKVNELNAVNAIKQQQHVNKHRRMHSFPNIQINLLKKNSLLNNTLPAAQESTINTIEESKIPKIVLNDDFKNQNDLEKVEQNKPCEESLLLEDNQNNNNELLEKTTIFDFIHSVQLQSECSQLDKENSHFIMADLAIASNELIKTNELFDEFSYLDSQPNRSANKSSSIRIKLNDRTFSSSMNDSFEGTTRSSSLTSNIYNSGSPGQALFIIDENKSISSGNDLNEDNSNTNDETKLKRDNWSKNHNKFVNELEESVSLHENDKVFFDLMDSTETSTLKHSKKSSLNNNNNSNSHLTEDGFEVVNCKQESENKDKLAEKQRLNSQDTLRSRRYSWEEVNDEETAENIANSLIKYSLNKNFELIKTRIQHLIINNNSLKCEKNLINLRVLKLLDKLRKKKQTIYSYLVPKLNSFEFFVQYLEYMEFMQYFYELKNSGKLAKMQNKALLTNNSNSISININTNQDNNNLSASTLYLSNQLSTVNKNHTINSNKPTTNLMKKSSSLFGSSLKSIKSAFESPQKSSTSITSPARVKSAALAAALTISLLQQTEDLQQDNYDIISLNQQQGTLPVNIRNQEKTNKLLRQLSYNIQDSLASSNEIFLSSLNQTYSNSLQSPQSLVLNSYKNLNSRIIGDEIWAPVREQLILNITRKPKRLDQIKLQHFRCADCGIQVRQDKIKTFYYCEYFTKYFCRCCHINNQSYIPAYVINSLDFRSGYEVSKKAKNFLEKIYNEPLITLESLNPSLFEGNTIFSRVKKLRYKLHNSRSYINSCRLAADLKDKLHSQFDDFIINDQHVYSIEILFKIKKGNFFDQLKNMVQSIIDHIKKCEICSQQGYICGICNKKDLLYPFDNENVEKCPNCLACYHIKCFKSPEQCPRCERKRNRNVSSSNSMNSSQSNDLNNKSISSLQQSVH